VYFQCGISEAILWTNGGAVQAMTNITQSIRNESVTFSVYHEGDEQALPRELSSRSYSYEQQRARFAGWGARHFWWEISYSEES